MDEAQFKLLISILKILEQEDYKKSNIETAVVKIIDHMENHLTDEQKEQILKEFIHYEEIRKGYEDERERKAIFKKMEYEDIIKSSMSDTGF